jgi:hypothetical protein
MPAGVHPYTGQNFTLRLTLVDQNEAAITVPTTAVMQIRLTNPAGTTVTKTASKPAGDSSTAARIEYAASTSDCTVSGTWLYQGRLVKGGLTYLTKVESLIVAPNP